jgi:hypothetical protein
MFISKRVLIIIGVVAVVVVGLTVFAFVFFLSQANQTSASATVSTPTVGPTATTKPTLRACALGTIESISTSASSFVISKGAKTVTIMVNGTTIIRSHGKKIALTDLAVGDQVRVVAQGTCDKTAQSFSAQVVMVVTGIATPAVSPTP